MCSGSGKTILAIQALKQMVTQISHGAQKGEVEVVVLQGMENRFHRDRKNQLLEDLKAQHGDYFVGKDVKTSFLTVRQYMRREGMTYSGKDSAANINNIVTKLANEVTKEKKTILVLDEIQVDDTGADISLLPTLVPQHGFLKVIICFRPSSKLPAFPASPWCLILILIVSYRQSMGMRKALEPLFMDVYGFSILEGDTSLLYQDPSSHKSLSWANFEKMDEKAVTKVLSRVKKEESKKGETRRCAFINMTNMTFDDNAFFQSWCKRHGE